MTKEKLQKYLNAFNYYDVYGKQWKLYHCQAKIEQNVNVLYLISYNTVVAWYDCSTFEFCDVLRVVYRYTATSSQHIRKFQKWLKEQGYQIFYYETVREIEQ